MCAHDIVLGLFMGRQDLNGQKVNAAHARTLVYYGSLFLNARRVVERIQL